ncbi:hypothetical protein DSAG12_00374 [Promethearchaeum syntrophicum]|uniref:Uncharacterized protein n=1 Tax=Promethearchaeum syntrophicum TaxID=2594042 RepID=A0A5B9D6I3_9ARCH|nr:hypothetical protein [Candidatus Prometheoarchaeum syntrophicum]QEE14561.1 hypothetical protein DSAG12_00374 [Candidatus Prometheoarchaeum syntrophicum]
MISKEEAEEKLLKIYYDAKLDSYFDLYPTSASIEEFGETKDSDEFDSWYCIEDDKLLIGMWANNYEHGIPYFAVIMAHGCAKNWREDPLAKHMKLYAYSHLIIPIILIFLVGFISLYSRIGAILINLLGIGIIIYFIILKIKWKKRVLIRFRELFGNTGIYLPEEKIKKYSKSRFPDIIAITILQGFVIFCLLIISLALGFSNGV